MAKNTPAAVTFIEDESFNYYVDNIFKHLNEILHKDYDPVTVPLTRHASTGAEKKVVATKVASRSIDERETEPEAAERKVATKQSPNQIHTAVKSQLYGLSTLKRIGNVKISHKKADSQVEDDITTIKSNFVLGPLTLKVQKITTRSGQKNYKKVRSATATTAEMLGRVNLRVKNGVASLYSIKVQQPKQVIQLENILVDRDRRLQRRLKTTTTLIGLQLATDNNQPPKNVAEILEYFYPKNGNSTHHWLEKTTY